MDGTGPSNWRTTSLLALTFSLLLLFILTSEFGLAQQPATTGTGIWLVDPPARLLERNGPANQRLPERTCPTHSTGEDALTTVPAGVPFRVRWRDPGQLPVDLAKLEVFTTDGGHLLARLDIQPGGTFDDDEGNGTSVSVQAQIPAGLRCPSCILRLSVELDERIQLLSCAQVRIQPVQLEGPEPTECTANIDCGHHGQCQNGLCFCAQGFFGERCAIENAVSIAPSPSAIVQSVRFPASGSQFRWLASSRENALRLGLTFPSGSTARWFILGLQSTESDPKCQLAMDQWKQRLNLHGEEADTAKAQAGVLIRVEQEQGENSLAGGQAQPRPSAANRKPSILNIRKLPGDNETAQQLDCGPNQRWEQCPETSRECEPSCDWTSFPESIPACPARTEQCGQPRCICVDGFVRLGNHKDECKPFAFCQAPEVTSSFGDDISSTLPSSSPPSTSPADQQKQQKCPQNETWEKCGPACEPSCQSMYNEEPCGASCEAAGCTCSDNFVRAQDGRCIQWTECPNLKERITVANQSDPQQQEVREEEAVSRGTGPPKEHQKPGATIPPSVGSSSECADNETLNECGRICEADCQTIFEREECHKCGQEPACACRQGFARLAGQCIYWGDCPELNPPSTTFAPTNVPNSKQTASKHSGQVGAETTTTATTTTKAPTVESTAKAAITEEPPMDLCRGQWSWPAGCTDQSCLYILHWELDEATDSVLFSLENRPAVSRKMPRGSPIWSGVGFSPSGTLLDADMIVLANEGDKPALKVTDMHVDEELEQLRVDRQQDVQLLQGQFQGGLLKARFSRKRRTGDAAGEDLEFGDEGNCFRFLFPVSGGRFERSGNTSVPVADSLYASDAEICVRACKESNSAGNESKQPTAEDEQQKEAAGKKKADPAADFSCQDEFRWPEGCKEEQCEYRARWAWQQAGDSVQFNISSRGIGRWTGIGFSKDGRMSGSDIVTGWVYDHKPFLTDRFAFAQQQPAIDPLDRQDLFDIGGSLVDDIQTISFRRKVLSPDRSTDLALAPQCLHFLFPVQGGRVLARSSRDFQQARTPIGFHDQQQPIASARRICLCDRPELFKSPEQQRMGRARRAAADEDAAGPSAQEQQPQQGGGPYQCADIALFQVLDGGRAVRVVDAFGLSNDSLRRDESWGGRQSFEGIEVQSEGQQTTIWVRKTLTDPNNENADLLVGQGQIPVFLATGQGPTPAMGLAQRLEFAMVDLMAGASSTSQQPATAVAAPSTPDASTTPQTKRITATSTPPATTTTTTTLGTSRTTEGTTVGHSSATEAVDPTSLLNVDSEPTQRRPSDGQEQQSAGAGEGPSDAQPAPMPAPAFQPTADQQPSSAVGEEFTDEAGDNRPPSSAAAVPPALLMDENCFGGFAFPEGCMAQQQSHGQCQYTLEWLVQPEAATVHFRLNARMPADHWTGVGFSADGAMMNADALIVLLLPDGQVSVQDQFSPGYGRPNIDLQQNVGEVSSGHSSVDGSSLWSVNFSRPLYTADAQDADLRECQHFLFMHSPNPLVPASGELRKHVETPIISASKICLGNCNKQKSPAPSPADIDNGKVQVMPSEAPSNEPVEPAAAASSTPTSFTFASTTTTKAATTTPSQQQQPADPGDDDDGQQVQTAGGGPGPAPKSQPTPKEQPAAESRLFNVAIRLPMERWDARLEEPESAEFARLAQKVSASLQALIAARWPSLASIHVQKFAEGSVLALLQLRFNGTSASSDEQIPTAKQLKQFLQDSAAQGMAAELILDRDMLEVQEDRSEADQEEEDKWGPLRELQTWLLAGLGLLLLLCIVAALLFCTFRGRRRHSQHRTFPTKHQQMQNGHGGGPGGMFNGGGTAGYHQGQYAPFPCEKDRESDTTAKTSTTNAQGLNGGGGLVGGGKAAQSRRTETPRGIGEATYREWFSKVASKDTPSHYQEHWQMPPPTPLPRAAQPQQLQQSPYLSYPNDPAFYTLNGEHRIVPPPPAYYRPF